MNLDPIRARLEAAHCNGPHTDIAALLDEVERVIKENAELRVALKASVAANVLYEALEAELIELKARYEVRR